MQHRQKRTIELLGACGIRPSQQRIAILDYLTAVTSHPSADQVFAELSPKMPTLSKATVYNTLNLFAEKGAARLVTIDPVERRFDADMRLHAHFRCNACECLTDIFITPEQQNQVMSMTPNNDIFTADIYFSGICPNCKTKRS